MKNLFRSLVMCSGMILVPLPDAIASEAGVRPALPDAIASEAGVRPALPDAGARVVYLDRLDLSGVIQEYGKPGAGKSVDGNPVAIGGKTFKHGVGTHANGDWFVDLGGKAVRFSAWVGIDDERTGLGSAEFRVYGDGKLLFESGVTKGGEPAKRVDVSLAGVRRLRLNVRDAGDGIEHDHADWADAVIETPAPGLVKPAGATGGGMFLDELDLSGMTSGWLKPQARLSVEGNPLAVGGTRYERGIGTHAPSEWAIDLGGKAKRFSGWVGLDDEKQGCGSVVFRVTVDGRTAFDSGVTRIGEPPKRVEIDLAGARRMRFLVTDGGDDYNCDHADWADATVEYAGEGKPGPSKATDEPPPPLATGTRPEPRINGPRIVGATPGRPFIFRIPATGEGPLTFTIKSLPDGLSLDSRTGIITGAVRKAGEYRMAVTVTGVRGRAMRNLTIVGGNRRLALTPPMGWNSWNVWGCAVDAEKVKTAADWMVKSGLAAHGYAYINIDDCWEKGRDSGGEILTNEKFPDMKGLVDYVHSRGLKIGIYSSPGPKTCGNFEGSWKHEEQDARTYAKWGIDYLKYDWCSYGAVAKGEGRESYVLPYRVMREALDKAGRDIVFSYCQYGMDKVWEWGAKEGGNLWRTTGDINDSWASLNEITFRQPEISSWAGPGHWNDPDMLVVGRVGWGPSLRPSGLTRNEQILHITAWCLLDAPLLIGCDMTKLDDFTLALLTNDEVLEVNQDLLGRAAKRVSTLGDTEVWARPLSDGTLAVGLFNREYDRTEVVVRWADLKIAGRQPVRDLWEQKDLGGFDGSFAVSVPAHGAMLTRIGAPAKTD
jgi:alpha-galactosidase